MNEFEQKLSRRPLREIPGEWRDQMIGRASGLSQFEKAKKAETGGIPVLLLAWREFLWPHPKAWAGLAAIWILIFAVNVSIRDKTSRMAEKAPPLSPEIITGLQQQRLLFAELIDANETRVADRQKVFLPKPRSECAEILTA